MRTSLLFVGVMTVVCLPSVELRSQEVKTEGPACCELSISVDPIKAPVGKDVLPRLCLRNISTNREITLVETNLFRDYQIEVRDENDKVASYTDSGTAMEADGQGKKVVVLRSNYKTLRPMEETVNRIELNLVFMLNHPGHYRVQATFSFPPPGTFRDVTSDMGKFQSNTVEFVIQ